MFTGLHIQQIKMKLKKQEKPPKREYCWGCGAIFEDINNSEKKKNCPRCKGRLGKIIE